MELFLMVLALSLLGVAVSAMAFGAATRGPAAREEYQPVRVPAPLPAPQFFIDRESAPTRMPVGALLLQIERHVQLEQAAAESFLSDPTAESLHLPSMSPLVH